MERKDDGEAREEAKEEGKKVLSLKDRSVETITLVDGTKTVRFKCLDLGGKLCKSGDQSKWELVTPLSQLADAATATTALGCV